MDSPRNYLISDVTLNWARLDTPNDGKYGPRWEVSAVLSGKDQADELSANHFNVKEKDGVFSVSLARKAEDSSGAPMAPVRVVDASKAPMESEARRKIGNGSKGSVIVWQAPYSNKFGTGITASLTAVQVTELVEYSSGGDDVDFGMVAVGSTPADDAAMF